MCFSDCEIEFGGVSYEIVTAFVCNIYYVITCIKVIVN